jgi:hypothetical protein
MKKLIIILLTIIILGCDRKQYNKDEDIYNVLKVMYDHMVTSRLKITALPQPIPPSSLVMKKKSDSINIKTVSDLINSKDTINLIKSFIKKNGRYIVSIDSILRPPYTLDIEEKHLQEFLDFKQIYASFKSIKDSVNVDVSLIPNNEYSYVIPYKSYYKDLPSRGYNKIDIGLWFSNIAFNQKRNKAILIVGVGLGRLNGFSAIYFLEKRKVKWFIKYKKGLTIS